MEPLKNGDKIRMKVGHRDWIGAQVIEKTEFPRSVVVETESGAKYRQNHHHLHTTKAVIKEPIEVELNENPANSNQAELTLFNEPNVEQTNTHSTTSQSMVQSNANTSPSGHITIRSGRIVKPVIRYGEPVKKQK